LCSLVGGAAAGQAVAEGAFRATGEVHRCMYDGRSLAAALREAGCVEPRLCGPSECAIPAFASYDLDTIGPRVRKPGALFAEGVKRA
jgi:hypothetical protein